MFKNMLEQCTVVSNNIQSTYDQRDLFAICQHLFVEASSPCQLYIDIRLGRVKMALDLAHAFYVLIILMDNKGHPIIILAGNITICFY
jgi:hypothetical protein